MKFTTLGLIAIIALALVASVSASVPMYESKYAPFADPVSDGTGTLSITTVSHYNWIGSQMTIRPVVPKSVDVYEGGRIQEDVAQSFGSDVGLNSTVTMRPDGTYDTRITRGSYVITLTSSDGGRAEYAYATISQGHQTDIRFQGRAVSEWTEPVVTEDEQPCLTITSAMYGAPGGFHIDVTAIVQGLVVGDHVSITAAGANYNALFGDPVPGVFKELVVTYNQNGVTGTTTVDEATDLNI